MENTKFLQNVFNLQELCVYMVKLIVYGPKGKIGELERPPAVSTFLYIFMNIGGREWE